MLRFGALDNDKHDARALIRELRARNANTPRETLAQVEPPRVLLEDFRPLAECLESRLADFYWKRNGVAGFLDQEVPYVIHNDGWLSWQAAHILFANCEETSPTGAIHVVEVGAGTGLFGRFLLDAFQRICSATGRDFYDRLLYLVSDASPATVEFWKHHGVFAEHHDRVRCEVADAAAIPAQRKQPVQAIFANYILDTLPAALVRRAGDQWEQSYVRTWLRSDPNILASFSQLSAEELRDEAERNDESALEQLSGVLPLLELESRFQPAQPNLSKALVHVKAEDSGANRVLNYGAMDFLHSAQAILRPGGFILVSDYPVRAADDDAAVHAPDRFGRAVAVGLDFATLDAFSASIGLEVATADRESEAMVQTRLLHLYGPNERPTVHVFQQRLTQQVREANAELERDASDHAQARRWRKAFAAWGRALETNPHNWRLLCEAAEFAADLGDHAGACELALASLELNPWYSPKAWHVLVENLVRQGRLDAAHACILEASRTTPRDPKSHLLAAESWLRRSEPQRALAAIAQGLAADRRDMLRHLLLDRQREALEIISVRETRSASGARTLG